MDTARAGSPIHWEFLQSLSAVVRPQNQSLRLSAVRTVDRLPGPEPQAVVDGALESPLRAIAQAAPQIECARTAAVQI